MSTVLATQVRKHTSKPTRAAGRYWKGKAPKGAAEYPSDSNEDDEEQLEVQEGDVLIGGEQDIVREDENEETTLPVKTGQGRVVKAMNLALKDVNISKDGKVIVAGREESGRTKLEEGACLGFCLTHLVLNAAIDVVSEEESEEPPDEEEDESEVCLIKACTMFILKIISSLANLRKKPQSRYTDLFLFRSTF